MIGKTRTTDPWTPYVPSLTAPWDLRRVVHLHRAAGFAAPWPALQRDLKEGPAASIDRMLRGNSRNPDEAERFESIAAKLAEAAVIARDPGRLKAWWVYRMLFSSDPLGERLTLMWHDHFATSNLKVDDLAAMRRQNDLFRQHARAHFGKLLWHVVHDPALLIWLDAPANRKGHPNENLARELMELFTLGVGHYTEADVKQAARALTGLTIADGSSRDDPSGHDDGEKVILGRAGRWGVDHLAGLLLDQPATAARLAERIVRLLLGEVADDRPGILALADGLRRHDLDIGWAVETVLRSETFFAESSLGKRVLGPAEFVVGAARALELFDPPPSTLHLADWITRMGQDLFYPPNVGGWAGGRRWLTSRSVVARANFAAALVEGDGVGRSEAFDASILAEGYGRGGGRDDLTAFFCELLLGNGQNAAWRHQLADGPALRDLAASEVARRIVPLILTSTRGQLA